jgi:hypothetical protein
LDSNNVLLLKIEPEARSVKGFFLNQGLFPSTLKAKFQGRRAIFFFTLGASSHSRLGHSCVWRSSPEPDRAPHSSRASPELLFELDSSAPADLPSGSIVPRKLLGAVGYQGIPGVHRSIAILRSVKRRREQSELPWIRGT